MFSLTVNDYVFIAVDDIFYIHFVKVPFFLWWNLVFDFPLNFLQVEETSDLSSCTEQILSCGYTGPINEDSKAKITRFILYCDILFNITHRACQLTFLSCGQAGSRDHCVCRLVCLFNT